MDRLDNTIRPYAWGSTTALPELLGTEPTGEPQAELWMGAHPGAPSQVERDGRSRPLTEVIADNPEGELGAEAARTFGPRLPFLLKLLAAGAPLSLQVHPDPEQARRGFTAEEECGVPRDAPERTYRDASHKPELICALTQFDALCGFRPADEAADLLAGLDVDSLKPYADILRATPGGDALREVLTAVLSAGPEEMAATVGQAAEAAARVVERHAPEGNAEEDAATGMPERHIRAYDAYARIARHYPGDPGVIAAMLLNHVPLQPGEALYLDAGVPHAYLEGLGVEVMANSDNVLRCGLTSKHMDVPELLRIVRFDPGGPGVLRPEADPDGEEVYETPAQEFRLSRHVLAEGAAPRALPPHTPQILLCAAGQVTASGHGERQLTLTPGQSAYVSAGETVRVSGAGTLFRATVGV